MTQNKIPQDTAMVYTFSQGHRRSHASIIISCIALAFILSIFALGIIGFLLAYVAQIIIPFAIGFALWGMFFDKAPNKIQIGLMALGISFVPILALFGMMSFISKFY